MLRRLGEKIKTKTLNGKKSTQPCKTISMPICDTTQNLRLEPNIQVHIVHAQTQRKYDVIYIKLPSGNMFLFCFPCALSHCFSIDCADSRA